MTHDKPTALCQCGCGSPAPVAKDTDPRRGWVKGQPKRFVRGHHQRGTRHPMYREDSWRLIDGYVFRLVHEDHPFFAMASLVGTSWYIAEHRLVMAEHLGRPLLGGNEGEIVHHKAYSEGGSGDKTDNRIENLTLFSNHAEHIRHHRAMRRAS